MFNSKTSHLRKNPFKNKIMTRKCCLCIAVVLITFIIFSIQRNSPINDLDRKYRLAKIDEFIKQQANSQACKQPKLPVDSPEMLKFVHEVPPIDCTRAGIDWVKCENSECRIQEQIKLIHGHVKCSFTDLMRINDFQSTDGSTSHSDGYYLLEKSDVVRVSCRSEGGQKWSATLTGIRVDKRILDETDWDYVPKGGLQLNVLMFGFDSISRNSFVRKLPKSYEYLTSALEGIVLEGYNIVGDGTPQALIPVLTGKTELELPDTRKRLPNTQFVNSYPFIWNDYKKSGYVTGFFEDVPDVGTFTYRLNGFNEPPTDHYMRPYYLASSSEQNKWPKLCNGDTPRHKIMFNQIKNFYNVYKDRPKFLFAFHGELSHDDYNLIGAADSDFKEFLEDLNKSGVLENTLLIIMADHGHRFAQIRNTVQGKQEERLPFFSFTFPKTFKYKHADVYDNFRRNVDKLSTPFDIYTTLKNVLFLENTGIADISKRSVSLFSEIPASRSCADAYIEPHWCACLDWENVNRMNPIVNRLAETLVEALNNYTQPHRHMCASLKVQDIEWATRMVPNDNLLKFKHNADLDGFVADLSANMQVKSETYQIKVKLIPGDSIFEASLTHVLDKNDNKLVVNLKDVSRINMYGRQARCVENDSPDLRKYCYCTTD